MESELDEIVKELKIEEDPSTLTPPASSEPITDETAGEYVYAKAQELVELSLSAVQSLKDTIRTGTDPKEITAYAQLIKATKDALETVNQINLQSRQHKSDEALKKLDVASRNKLIDKLPQQTNVLIMTREEALKNIESVRREKLIENRIIESEVLSN